ncbi:MAG TPA: prepilin-type N-terminal cleavage/methylation domain-containing protein [Thermoanaerobaculia bacterium]|nr:prepilin-type N-terminal cleavage/methylation domain-containing protein [Thermoanaerobaculia bacterium]
MPVRTGRIACPPHGYTLIEVVVAMAVFGIFLMILGVLTVDMRRNEKRMPVNFMRHPQIDAVISRLRRDVLDAHGSNPYRETHDGYTQGSKTLILESVQENGGVQMIVWDFRNAGEVKRRAYNVGVATQWIARGVPEDFASTLVLQAVGIPGRPWGVRVTARDERGRIAIDQILQPRAHE